jgi:hypothetical protein
MSLADVDKKITVLAKLFGGQGTINVPSWSPDSKQVAFVSYMLIPSADTVEAKLTDDDYAIFSAAIQHTYPNDKFDRIVLIDRTGGGYPPGLAAMTHIGAQELQLGVPDELRESLKSRNAASAGLDRGRINLKLEVITLPYETANKMVTGGWEAFHNQYRRSPGITLLSLPGLNAEKNQALLYVATSCGILCGGSKQNAMLIRELEGTILDSRDEATIYRQGIGAVRVDSRKMNVPLDVLTNSVERGTQHKLRPAQQGSGFECDLRNAPEFVIRAHRQLHYDTRLTNLGFDLRRAKQVLSDVRPLSMKDGEQTFRRFIR